MLLIFAPCLSFAGDVKIMHNGLAGMYLKAIKLPPDSTSKKLKKQQEEEKKRIKEISKARRQAKPEKIDENVSETDVAPGKPKRQRRPVGVERPPEIPRRNND